MLLDDRTRRALLLQGPGGPFFRLLADELESRGVEVTKVNFSPGDALFYRGADVLAFRRPMSEWPAFFSDLLDRLRIDTVYLFGHCRPHHRVAIRIAEDRGVLVRVFEEGYLRPDFITLESDGVNGNSRMPRDPDVFRREAARLPELPPPAPVGKTFWRSALFAILHALALTLAGWRYPYYRHHRDVNAWKQAYLWGRGFVRKLWYAVRERGLLDRLRGEWAGHYFFVPLQVHCDAQLSHSPFATIDELIVAILTSFAENAPDDSLLVLKHHPHDRAYRDYGGYLRDLARRHGIGERVIYVHDLHLPTLLRNARGTVTMNSTVGLSSLYHGTPVKVLGTAVYDIPGLTFQGELAAFWTAPGAIDRELHAAFRHWLRHNNQINGSFYKRLPGVDTPTGLRLPPPMTPEPGGRWPEAAGKRAEGRS